MRIQAGYSQQELAEAAGVAQHTISEIELGRRTPRGRTLRKLAGALNVQVADLLERPEAPKALAPSELSQEGAPTALGKVSFRIPGKVSYAVQWIELLNISAARWEKEAQSPWLNFDSAQELENQIFQFALTYSYDRASVLEGRELANPGELPEDYIRLLDELPEAEDRLKRIFSLVTAVRDRKFEEIERARGAVADLAAFRRAQEERRKERNHELDRMLA